MPSVEVRRWSFAVGLKHSLPHLAGDRYPNCRWRTTNDQRRVSYQTKTRAQVNSPCFLVAPQLLGRSVPENFAFVDDVGPVGYGQRLPYIVVRNQHSNAGGLHVADNFLQIEYRNGINPRKGLIQQDELGIDA